MFGRKKRFRRSQQHGPECAVNKGTAEPRTEESNKVDITRIKSGESARIVEINGPEKPVKRLHAMGIVPGTVITKKSSSAMKGPVVIERNMVKIAIGFRMAQMIIVEPVEKRNVRQGTQL